MKSTLEELLSMVVPLEKLDGTTVMITPEFRVSVQGNRDGGIHFIIYPYGYNGDTLDFIAKGNEITPL